jgi:hypothetical protein
LVKPGLHTFVENVRKSKINPPYCTVGKVDFWIFWIFNFLQLAIYGKNNSKTKVEKVFFFIFMSSYAEMSFLNQKSLYRDQNFFLEISHYGVKKSVISRWFQNGAL